MFLLSPPKLLVILVVALVVLGPDKLPTVANKVGRLWRDFRAFREKLESEVRGTFPDLPSTETITQAVRSPLTFLDSLTADPGGDDATGAEGPDRAAAATDVPFEPSYTLPTADDAGRPAGSPGARPESVLRPAPSVDRPPVPAPAHHGVRSVAAHGVDHAELN